MKKVFFIPLISLLLIGCGSVLTTTTRTGFKTFVVDGYCYLDRFGACAGEAIRRDASKLCYSQYKITNRQVRYEGDQARYIFEVECLGKVNEDFHGWHKDQPIYIFY